MPVTYDHRCAHCSCCLAGAAREFLVETWRFAVSPPRLIKRAKQRRRRQAEPPVAGAASFFSSSATASQPLARRADGDGRGEAALVIRGEAVERRAERGCAGPRRATPSGVSGSVAAASGHAEAEENERDRGRAIPRSPFAKVPEWR